MGSSPFAVITCLVLLCLQFRAAIQLQFDFHRAIYNLGTVLVRLTLALSFTMWWHILLFPQIRKNENGKIHDNGKYTHWSYLIRNLQYGLAEDISRTGGHVNAKEVSPDELYSQSAIYIAAAHALKPNYSVSTIPAEPETFCSFSHLTHIVIFTISILADYTYYIATITIICRFFHMQRNAHMKILLLFIFLVFSYAVNVFQAFHAHLLSLTGKLSILLRFWCFWLWTLFTFLPSCRFILVL